MKRKGLSAAALKWIALASMLIDHATHVFYRASLRAHAPLMSWEAYLTLRGVGRLAFPIYAFLLAEGYAHTRSKAKYLARLGIFALLSELPFDLALKKGLWDWSGQNVFFTLFLGLGAIWLFELATEGNIKACGLPRAALGIGAVLILGALGWLGKVDYSVYGVLVVAAMGIFRSVPAAGALVSAGLLYAASPLEAASYVDFALFRLYNGKRGRQNKVFFYCFYPGHLLLLWLLRRVIYGS